MIKDAIGVGLREVDIPRLPSVAMKKSPSSLSKVRNVTHDSNSK